MSAEQRLAFANNVLMTSNESGAYWTAGKIIIRTILPGSRTITGFG